MKALGHSDAYIRRHTNTARNMTGVYGMNTAPLVAENRTRYPKRRRNPSKVERVLKSGHNNPKIGSLVQGGQWQGMRIYTLTLEERATCPPTCAHRADCYGNKMHFSDRHIHGEDLENKLTIEVANLSRRDPAGFIVRLHVLGDFYSMEYLEHWLWLLKTFPALHIFGYTAWPIDTPIGARIANAAYHQWKRFAVRTSDGTHEYACTVSLDHGELDRPPAITCPEQATEGDTCCAQCGLCWSAPRSVIAFRRH